MSRCLRYRDVHKAAKTLHFGQAGLLIHDRAAIWAKSHQLPHGLGSGHVIRHVAGRLPRHTAPEAIHLPWLARTFSGRPLCLQKLAQQSPLYQRRPLFRKGRQALFDPFPHGVFVFAQPLGGFLNRVAVMNFYAVRIGVSRTHGSGRFFAHGFELGNELADDFIGLPGNAG